MKKSIRQFIAGLSVSRSVRLRAAGLSAIAVLLTGCWTSIWTVAPTVEPVPPVTTVYTTQVTTPTPKHTTTTTVTVTSFNNDWSFYLDLQAVAAAFAESNSVQEFERILNSSRYMINNLDLNRDGWIDYLRVIETRQGHHHVFLIQACLAPSVFQDVATLIAEWRADRLYVEVIGDRYLYGYNYVVRPVFVKRPPMWDVFGRPVYNPWVSPYYYGYWPTYYNRPKPVYLNHYQAYVNTYMTQHHYCHHCDYVPEPYWNGYSSMTQPHHRNDYAQQHPDESFEQRVTHQLSPNGSGVTVRNAGQLRTETQRQAKAAEKSETTTRTSGTTGSSRTSGTSGTSTRTSGSSTSTQTSSQRQPSTTVDTRVSKSGTTRTTIRTTDDKGRTTTVKRESSKRSADTTTRSADTSTRTSGTSGTSGRTSGTSTRSTDSSTRTSGTSGSSTRTRQ